MNNITIRNFTTLDEENIWNLYNNSELGELWPIKRERLFTILHGKDDVNNQVRGLVAEINNEAVGFIGFKYKVIGDENKGVITLVVVNKINRSIGVGKTLINEAITQLKHLGANVIKVGGGAGSNIWAGVPENLNTVEFFKKVGFIFEDDFAVDMTQNIENYIPPVGIYERVAKQNVVIRKAVKEDAQEILDFEKTNFLNWYDYFKQDVDKEDFDNLLVAEHNNEIIGVTGIWVGNCNWSMLFENNVGGGKALGIAPSWQGKGIGIALKSYGTELLKAKQVKFCFIEWTYEVDFYAKLGFTVWQRYYMGAIRF